MVDGTIIIGDALEKLKHIKDNTINCCITSPPYYGLRDYGVEGQLGQEESVEKYIENLVMVFGEVKRVLTKNGTLWVNIADSYAGSGKGRMKNGEHSKGNSKSSKYHNLAGGHLKKQNSNAKSKDLMGIPWLLALALREDGWYLRQDIIWEKPNAMPESVKDRCTRSHEYIFLLSKSKCYYYDAEAIKEPCVNGDTRSPNGSRGTLTKNAGLRNRNAEFSKSNYRNKRDVWSVSTKGFHGAHFAVFPELVLPCILAGCPKGGNILDPFCGSGTTGAVAIKNNRRFVGIELNEEYAKISAKRIGVSLCFQCRYNTDDYVCSQNCGGCDGVSNFKIRGSGKE